MQILPRVHSLNVSIDQPASAISRRIVWAEVALVFAVFFIQGAYPVPGPNEPYYLGKAIHYWNSDWIPDDSFLDSADTHKVFYFAFGWLSLLLSPIALAWVGRLLTWGLLAYSWQRLSFALVPRRWWSILTAALLVCLIERCAVAGEWVVGGVEAKGFSYALVFLGLEALVGNRWNRAWLLLGGAALFHVLVGGWSVVAAGVAWLWTARDRPPLRSMWPGLAGGFLLSLPGLVPSLMLTWGVEPEIVSRANQVYVFERLAHHLVPSEFPARHVFHFVLLVLCWGLLCRAMPAGQTQRRFRGFVLGAILITLLGAAIGLATGGKPTLAAGLLRFYWFRLSDVAVPMGAALGGTALVVGTLQARPAVGKLWLAAVLLLAGLHVGGNTLRRVVPSVPPADRVRSQDYRYWRHVCRWIAWSGNTPPEARFLTPRMSRTFKWYAGRSEVVTWKDIPQDARSIVEWWDCMQEIHATGSDDPQHRWHNSLAELGAERLARLGAKYKAGYVLTVSRPRLELDVVYENRKYVVYRLDGSARQPKRNRPLHAPATSPPDRPTTPAKDR